MADKTGIEWTDSTFNPWIGCTRVSPACDDCYAARSTPARALGVQWGAGQERRRTSPANWRLPLQWNRQRFMQCGACGWRGERAAEIIGCGSCGSTAHLDDSRRRVFCASLADVFDNEVPAAWRAGLFALIAQTPNLDWLVLTKRIGNVLKMLDQPGMQKCGLPPNVWLGATVVNQAEADRDVPKLLAVQARVRFLSIEPMLGAVDLTRWLQRCDHGSVPGPAGDGGVTCGECLGTGHNCKPLHWVICGGESGPQARPMHPGWAESLRDQCAAAGVPFLFKQWGEWCPRGPESSGYAMVEGVPRRRITETGANGQDLAAGGSYHVWMNRVGKRTAGRKLAGHTHDGFPA